MPLTAIPIYAPGDIITSAWANILRDNFDAVDARTGGDPGAAGRLAVSNGATSSVWTAAVSAIIGALGYTPANKAGDTFNGNVGVVGDLGITGIFSGASIGVLGQVAGGSFGGGSVTLGIPSVLGLTVGTNGIASAGPIGASVYNGGSTAGGIPSFQGINVGTNGIVSAGPVNPLRYDGGSTGGGIPSFQGINVGVNGISSAGAIFIAGQQVYSPFNPPPAGVSVPSGMIAAFRTAAEIASGWARETVMDGRLPVGAGTSFGQTFAEGTSYGGSWAHQHTSNSFGVTTSVSVSVSVNGSAIGGPSDNTGAPSASGGTVSGTPPPSFGTNTHTHALNGVSLAVSASGSGSGSGSGSATGDTSNATWLPPMRAVVWARKS
jgi:hypothetical protein